MPPATEPVRISVDEVGRRLQNGEPLLLVCAYEDEKSFQLSRLKSAIPYSEYLSRRSSLPPEAPILFY